MMYPEAGPPDGFHEMLEKLFPGITMHVPDDILELWFPPGAVLGRYDDTARRADGDAGLATFERHLIKARAEDGRKRAEERGVRFGRPPKLTSRSCAA